MSNSDFLTSNTSSLTPSTFNLVNLKVRCFMKMLPWRSNGTRGRRGCALLFFQFLAIFRSQFVLESLIGQEIGVQPIKRTVSYAIWCQYRQLTEKILPVLVASKAAGGVERFIDTYGSIGGSWLAAKQTSSFKKSQKIYFGAMTPWKL